MRSSRASVVIWTIERFKASPDGARHLRLVSILRADVTSGPFSPSDVKEQLLFDGYLGFHESAKQLGAWMSEHVPRTVYYDRVTGVVGEDLPRAEPCPVCAGDDFTVTLDDGTVEVLECARCEGTGEVDADLSEYEEHDAWEAYLGADVLPFVEEV